MAADVQSMHQYWKNFDLQELQRGLDTTATELATRQDESDASRKKLVEQSREFKKNTPEDIRKVVAPLLKSFQLEVDTLSKRSKNAEAAFLTVYKRLIDLPDPVPALEHALEIQKKARKASDLELENKKLRETLAEYNNEFAEVKNQEVTIKQLKEKLREYDEKMEANAQLRAKDKEKELQRQFADKERQLQETQLSVAKKLGEAEHKVSTLQSALDSAQSELFDLKAKYDEATAAKSDEVELVMADLERANEKAASAEREVEQLKSQLASVQQNLSQAEQMQQAPDMEQALHILKRSSLEVELAAKEKEISQLVEDVQKLQSALNKLREHTTAQVNALEEELTAKSRAFKLLEEKIQTQEDYEEIRRELSVMKSLEFGAGEDSDSKTKSLEQLLLEKNRTLQTDNTQLKVTNSDLSGSSATSQALSTADMFPALTAAELSYRQSSVENGGPVPSSGALIIAPSTSSTSSPVPSRPQSYLNGSCHSPTQDPSEMAAALNGLSSDSKTLTTSPSLQRLQSITRAETNNAQMLDTAGVAQNIREILSAHNIGQRLFAKHVLGLSQGTVSELLSKPKHWDKLTEKGRESYRKMHAWSTDDQNILALKAISPKKGNQPMLANAQKEDAATEERINAILTEAQVAMHAKTSQERVFPSFFQNQITNAMVESIYQQQLSQIAHQTVNGLTPSQTSSLSGSKGDKSSSTQKSALLLNGLDMTSRGRRAQVDQNLTQDMVARIYQEELSKLARAAEKSGNMAEYALYQQELARMAMQSSQCIAKEEENKENKKKDHSKREKSPAPLKVKREPSEDGSVHSDRDDKDKSSTPDVWKNHGPFRHFSTEDSLLSQEASRHAGSAFFLVRPRSNSHPAFPDTPPPFPLIAEGMSMSPLQRMQSIANSLMTRGPQGQNNQRPLRAVLPPITQEQFDKYSNVNTDELVKQVKDALSQFSISQRLFGEHILGLSQGSVSDLLARPKPWHMLTQKGREPFIRMKIFLEDQESIPRLVANQYRIAPEKLLRSPNCYANCPLPSSAGSPDLSPPLPVLSLMHHAGLPVPMVSLASPQMVSLSTPQMAVASALDMSFSSPSGGLPRVTSANSNRGPSQVQPSMYEIAAMTTELDTLAITSKVKEVLQFHNLGQKLFGEAVLALSQGSVSELLSKPKPWHMLSLKGREPFIKMHMWLNDPHNLEKLRLYQSEKKARKSKSDDRSSEGPKKARVFFTDEQKETLRMAYAHDPYPNQTTIEVLATQLMVTPKTIVNWFHNHRMRAKQQMHNGQLKTEDDVGSNDSMSSETSSYYRPMSSTPSTAESQWMFPSLDAVITSSRRSSINSAGSEQEKIGSEDMDDAPHDLSTSKPVPPPPIPISGSSSKRKRAKPKWNYEGTQLDKNRENYEFDIQGEEPCDLTTKKKEERDEDELPEKLRIIEPLESASEEDEDAIKFNNNNQKGSSDKNQLASSCTKEWEERSENIEKLTKNLAVEKDENWEF